MADYAAKNKQCKCGKFWQDNGIFTYYLVPFFKYWLIFSCILKVQHEPLGESNTERRVKISASISKEGT